jgi:hypothetical protein
MAGTGTIGKQLKELETTAPAATVTTAPVTGSSAASRPAMPAARPRDYDDGPNMIVPAGFFGDVLKSLNGTVSEITGGYFGNPGIAQVVGGVANILPFSIIPPAVAPQSAGPDAGPHGSSEALVVVPSAFLGGLLGGIGGKLLGGTVGDWLGNAGAGETAGGAIGAALGGLLPFSVVPPSLAPQSAGPGAAPASDEPMVLVPAGFFGSLLHGVAKTVSDVVGGDAGQVIRTASPLLDLLPFHAVPPTMAPQSAGPDGAAKPVDLVVLPAGFFGSLLSGLAGTIGSTVGDVFGDAATGKQIGDAAAPILDMIPFHAVPPALAPQATGPGAGTDPADQLMLVPAGLFSGLLSGLAGTIGGAVGDLFGDARTGQQIGDAAGGLISLLPFHTVAPQSAG